MTPLGSPVLPLEKIIVAVSSSAGFLRAPTDLSISLTGENQEISAAVRRSRALGLSAKSSNMIACPGGCTGTRSRNALEVITVCNSHCFAHEARISLEAV